MKNFLVLLLALFAVSNITSCTVEALDELQEQQVTDPPPSQEETEEVDPNSRAYKA